MRYIATRGGVNVGFLPQSSLPSIRHGSLVTCGEGVEDILVYLIEFLSPLSYLCKSCGPRFRTQEETSYSFLKCSLFLSPLPLGV